MPVVEDRYALLPAQAGLVYNSLRGPAIGVDVVQYAVECAEPADRAAWDEAWRRAVARHPVLRTAYRFQAGLEPVQEVYREVDFRVDWHDVSGPHDAFLAGFLTEDRQRPFDVSGGPLFRVAVLCASDSRHTIVFTYHHAVLDGRSMHVLFGEVFAEYDAIRAGEAVSFPARRPYRDFVAWWQKYDMTAAKAFWTEFLAGADSAPGSLPGLRAEPPHGGFAEPVTRELVLDEAAGERLRDAATRAGVTMATLVNAAWGLVLSRYRGTDDVVFGVVRATRRGTVDGAESMVGLLINTVPVRVSVPADATVGELLSDVARRGAAVRDHQLAPLGDIQRWAGLPVGQPDTLVAFERQLLQSALTRVDPRFGERPITYHRQPSYPVTLTVYDEPRQVVSLIYDRRRLDDAGAARILSHVRVALTALAGDPSVRVADLALADAAERELLLRTWNDTTRPYPRDSTIPAAFAAQVARTPDAVAVVAGREVLTYAQLDARSNRLAHVLRERGVGADSRVGVELPRGADLVVALLAVLKAGGGYVPLDSTNPPARNALVLADSGASMVVDGSWFGPGSAVAAATDTPLPCPAHPLSVAYVSYTSGSTGTPKGVAIPHRAVLRLVHDPTFVTLGPAETLLALAPVAFDASTLELWGSLLTGARLAVAPPGPLDLPSLATVLRDSGVTTLWLTSGLFHQIVELDAGALAGVRQLLSGGDVLSPSAVAAALAARAGAPVINGYGPTENTTFITCHQMTSAADAGDRVPIGRPIQQTTAYVLDAAMRPCATGEPGELYTGGDGLARGYVGRPGFTAGRFVPDPFGERPGGRLYRTGDLARWRADGVLEFLGRMDGQVKIRGFRVEPGEVEAMLAQRPEVRQAVVVVRGSGESRHLDAYVTVDGAAEPWTLREHAARQLPDYLVPATVTVLDRLPLTANGKVDRAALPPPVASPDPGPAPREPASPAEIRLADIWREILGVAHVGGGDDFFALGGNSLAATRLIFRVRDAFGVNLPVLQLYEAPTLAGCAAAIEALGGPRPDTDRPDTDGGLSTPESGDQTRVDRPTSTRGAGGGITRRDRTAFRAAATPTAAVPAESTVDDHTVALAERWRLWRWVCLRSAGFPFESLESLASPTLAATADRTNEAGGTDTAEFLDEFARAERVLSRGLHAVAADPRFREAVAWQNRHALTTGIDALLRRDPETVARTGRYRKYEALVASYLQRYCAKNDTIGFYGPVGWAEIRDDVDAIVRRPEPGGTLARRTVYFEGWAVRALAEAYTGELRPWLIPRRLPMIDLSVTADGAWLRVPFAAPVRVSPWQAHVFRLVDGARTAAEIVEAARLDPAASAHDAGEVLQALADLHAAHRIAWTLDVAPDDIHPERTVRTRLSTVTDAALREPALAALDELESARDAVRGAPDPAALVGALGALDETFTRLTGEAPTRRAGETYAGRTLVFEECLRVDDVTFGPEVLAPLRDPLELILESARWFTAAGAALFRRACLSVYRERVRASGRTVVPLAEFWLGANDLIFSPPDHVAGPLSRALQERWAGILALPDGARRVQLSSADLRERVLKTFAVARPGWPAAVHHSPDVMIAAADAAAIRAGDFLWVMGELHPGLNTMRYATWVAYHPAPDRMRQAMVHDLGRPTVVLAPTGEAGGTPARLSNVLVGPDDTQLVFAYDSSGYDPRRALFPGECDLEESGGTLLVRRRGGGPAYDLVDVLADPLSLGLSQHFRLVPPSGHTPRVTIDRLVVQRESWTFPAAELGFAEIVDERRRFLAARRWVTDNDLPRYAFLRASGELKPIFVDLASLASIDLLSRAVRRTRRIASGEGSVTVSEMLPSPDQLWLTDAEGRRYTSELRVCAVELPGKGL